MKTKTVGQRRGWSCTLEKAALPSSGEWVTVHNWWKIIVVCISFVFCFIMGWANKYAYLITGRNWGIHSCHLCLIIIVIIAILSMVLHCFLNTTEKIALEWISEYAIFSYLTLREKYLTFWVFIFSSVRWGKQSNSPCRFQQDLKMQFLKSSYNLAGPEEQPVLTGEDKVCATLEMRKMPNKCAFILRCWVSNEADGSWQEGMRIQKVKGQRQPLSTAS